MLPPRMLIRTGQRLALRRTSPLSRPAFRRPYSAPTQGELTGAADNAFNRERVAVKKHAAETSDLWRKLSIYVVIPALAIAAANAYKLWSEHWEHWEHERHEVPLEEKVEYPYQNIRVKNYWFGNGDQTAFWNPKVNHHKKDE